jgi:hypothetical protein
MNTPAQIQEHLSGILWAHSGRSTIGFVHIEDSGATSRGSGTLIRFGSVVGILTCAHVLEALRDDEDIGILCFPAHAAQIQWQRFRLRKQDSISVGKPPWSEGGPDLAFVRLPEQVVGDIASVSTIVNGELYRKNIVAGEPEGTMKLCAMAGVVDRWTKPPTTEPVTKGISVTTTFEAVLNVGNVIVDDENTDRFRFQPVTTQGVILPPSYQGTSGAGLWKFYLARETFSLVEARLIGVAYWEKNVGEELHLVGHGQISIYDTLWNAVRHKWP